MTCCGVFQNDSSHFNSILAQKKHLPVRMLKTRQPQKTEHATFSSDFFWTRRRHISMIWKFFAKSSTILSSVPAQIILLTRFLSWQSFIVSHKRMDSNSSLEVFLTIAGSEAIRCYILLTRQMVLRRSLKGMKLKMCKITSSESSLNCAMN